MSLEILVFIGHDIHYFGRVKLHFFFNLFLVLKRSISLTLNEKVEYPQHMFWLRNKNFSLLFWVL